MVHNQVITDLAYILKQQEIRHVVICPGSRNAPLMQVFTGDDYFTCHSIVDERSAGFVALGMARQLNEPVVVLSTSGTAVLNLGPAVAEAFFQKISLVILTADRPKEWPPQFSNQIVNQEGVFSGNSLGSYSLPMDIENDEHGKKVLRKIFYTVGLANRGVKGPVHLNIPLKEPLYEKLPEDISAFIDSVVEEIPGEDDNRVSDEDHKAISKKLKAQHKVLIIAGAQSYSAEEELLLTALVMHYNAVVIAENISNLKVPLFVSLPDLVLGSIPIDSQALKPDLILSMGGQVVSKKMRLFVQQYDDVPVGVIDFFPAYLFEELVFTHKQESDYSYLMEWKKIEEGAVGKAKTFLSETSFCMLSAMDKILQAIPGNTVVHLGNSSSIRYSQLFDSKPDVKYLGNRGTSGIDGSLSTAVGSAMVSEELHLVILGDLSFVYDSNAMWNRDFPANLRIIVLNDAGGGIFRLIDGPDRMPFYEDFSVAHHPVILQQLTEAFGLNYRIAKDFPGLKAGLDALLEKDAGPFVLEVDTAKSENSTIFKAFFTSLQNQ